MLVELFNKSPSSNNIEQDGSISDSTFSTLINGNLPESLNDPLSEISNEHSSLNLRENNYVRSEIVQGFETDNFASGASIIHPNRYEELIHDSDTTELYRNCKNRE